MTPENFLFYGFAIVLLLRLIMVFTMGMMPQDAYYFFYSEHLSLSYFDHPPGVAVMLWLFTKVLGTEVWSLKLIDFLVTGAMLWIQYQLATRFLPRHRSLNLIYVFGSTLIITDVSIVTTPDVPLLLCWSLALLMMYDALHKGGILRWLLAGLLAGVAFNCKYTSLVLPIGFLAFLLLSKTYRRYFFSWRSLLFVVAFCTAILPVVFWNMENDFASFRFQSGDRVSSMLEFKLRPVYFIATVGHQMALLLPILAISIGIIFWKQIRKMWRRRRIPDDDTLFLLLFSAPLIVGFLAISWVYWVKINWLIPAYITASILVLRYLKTRWMRWQMWTALIANFLLMIQIVWYPINIQSDDTYWGWEELAGAVTQLRETHPRHFIFSHDGYKTTAMLNYYLDPKVYAGNVIGEHALEYSITDSDLSHLAGRNALFIDSQKMTAQFDDEYVPPESLHQYFEEIKVLPPITLYDAKGKALRQFAVVECKNYKGTGQ